MLHHPIAAAGVEDLVGEGQSQGIASTDGYAALGGLAAHDTRRIEADDTISTEVGRVGAGAAADVQHEARISHELVGVLLVGTVRRPLVQPLLLDHRLLWIWALVNSPVGEGHTPMMAVPVSAALGTPGERDARTVTGFPHGPSRGGAARRGRTRAPGSARRSGGGRGAGLRPVSARP